MLLFIIVLQFGYIIYKDITFSKERERLNLKIMAKDVPEYLEAVDIIEKRDEDTPQQENDFLIPVEEVGAEELLEAINK